MFVSSWDRGVGVASVTRRPVPVGVAVGGVIGWRMVDEW
jgi:hypothetical protein